MGKMHLTEGYGDLTGIVAFHGRAPMRVLTTLDARIGCGTAHLPGCSLWRVDTLGQLMPAGVLFPDVNTVPQAGQTSLSRFTSEPCCLCLSLACWLVGWLADHSGWQHQKYY